MMFEQCKIVIFKNIIFMKKHRNIFRKNSMEIFRKFPEKYEIFRTNFPPHITTCATRALLILQPQKNQTFNLALTDSLDAFERILGAVEDRCHKLGPRLITYAIPLQYFNLKKINLLRSIILPGPDNTGE